MKPMGNFTLKVNSDASRHIVLIGGGSGITPLLSIAKSVLLKEPNSTVTLLYGNRDQASIMFSVELNELQSQYPALKVKHVLEQGSDEFKGVLSIDMLEALLSSFVSDNHAEYYICGPAPVMSNAESVLTAHNIPSGRIHREFFTAPISVDEDADAQEESTEEKQISVKLYGRSYDITVNPGETILEAGIRQQLDPPYACQIAACCTCRAKLRTGKVHMESREALTDDEIEEGYILTCQAHPLTDDVLVDFDG
jgi:ring-1,2-phenylacetyl-CoA epoxidase subunit PaaE